MSLPASSLPLWMHFLGGAGFLAVLIWAGRMAAWRALRANGLVHVWFAAMVLVAFLWNMQVGIREGLILHLLGTASLVLIFGPALAILASFGALLINVIAGNSALSLIGVHGLLLVALPVWVAHQSHWQLRRWLPLNPFVYFLGSGFLGGMLALAAPIFVSAGMLWVFGIQPGWIIWKDYLVLLPLILFPEGFINGAVMTALAVWQPHWVRSFSDEDYLR